MWNIYKDGEDVEIDCAFQPTCYLCGGDMVVWNVKKLHFDLVPQSGDKKCHAVDIDVVCPVCHAEDVFGIAVSEDEYKSINAIELVH